MFTILHVDNSTFFRHVFREFFEDKGYRCLSAKDIDSAYYLLQGGSVNLIVTALEIRGGGGEHFIRSLNASEYRNIPVVVVTSNDSLEVRRGLFSLGVIDYIAKTRDFAAHLHDFITTMTAKDRARQALGEMRIAVLDDSSMELGIIRNILQLNGITGIDIYTDPFALLESNVRYQVYFIDLVLPGISGEQVILNLRKRGSDCVIIAISGIDNYKVIANVLLSGADDYMMKPFNASIFMARLVSNVRSHLLVNDLAAKNRELEKSSVTDELTGSHNHRHVHRLLEEAVNRVREGGAVMSMVLLGIDNFSAINEDFGHAVGDRVIRTVAKTIREHLRDEDSLGRYGGVEFMLIIPGTDLEGAHALAERIRQRINRINFRGRRISVSGGAVSIDGDEAMDLVLKAGSLLFNARKKGKNRIERSFDWSRY
ncbi:MAG: diguanylate cyclase [Spirochaetes bacterium]|nr:diguanylate cyclase [Spirochaetota bacterium]